MKNRSLLPRLSVLLMFVVVVGGAFMYAERLLLNGVPIRNISLILLGVLAVLAFMPLLLQGLQAIANTPFGRILRALIAVIFCVSLAMTILFGPLSPLLSSANNTGAILPGNLTISMVSAAVALLTAPIGWRAIFGYTSGRSSSAMPFFKASPMLLGVTFALAAVFFTLGPALIDSLAATEAQFGSFIGVNLLVIIPMLLLLCVITAVPLIFMLRLLQMGGDWIRQRAVSR